MRSLRGTRLVGRMAPVAALVGALAVPAPAAADCSAAYWDCVARTATFLPGGGVSWDWTECNAVYVRCVADAILAL